MSPQLNRSVAAICFCLLLLQATIARAGGPLAVGGTIFGNGVDGRPFVWETTNPISYRTPSDGTLGRLGHAQAVEKVQKLFQSWEDVATASIRFQNVGSIQAAGAYSGGPVNTAAKFEAVDRSCVEGIQSPIIFDGNGSLFEALGFGSGVIGFAGPCAMNSAGHIVSGEAVLNGQWIDGLQSNGELTENQFDEAFVHEFGHLIGLDHSQISVEVLIARRDQCDPTLLAALPLMFPFLHCQARADAGLPILSADDKAWVSKLYPETVNDSKNGRVSFDSVYGVISGNIFFSDKETAMQGVNLIARKTGDSQSTAVSVVSGYLFTGNPGQHLTGTNRGDRGFGSHNPLLIGSYDIPVPAGSYTLALESINENFIAGSGVGPLTFPIPIPAGSSASSKGPIAVDAGDHATGVDFVLQNTPPRFDQFEAP